MSTSLYWGRYPAQQRYPMQPFHFDPALAGQDVSSGSSSSSVVCYLIFFTRKKVVKNFTSYFSGTSFIHKKVRVLSFALPVLYFKKRGRLIFYMIVNFFLFFSLNIKVGQSWSWSWSWNRSRLLFSGSSQIRAAPGGSGFTKEYRYRYLPVSTGIQYRTNFCNICRYLTFVQARLLL